MACRVGFAGLAGSGLMLDLGSVALQLRLYVMDNDRFYTGLSSTGGILNVWSRMLLCRKFSVSCN